MAHIEKRVRTSGAESYRVRYRVRGQLVGETFTTQAAAAEFAALVDSLGGEAAERVREARSGAEQTTPLLRDFLTHYLDHLPSITDGTRAEYQRTADRSWIVDLGPLPLDAIDRDTVAKWITRQSKTLTRYGTPTSAKTLKNQHGLLSQVLAAAVEAGHIPKNVAKLGSSSGLALPAGEREEMVFLTHDEFAAVVGAMIPFWRPLLLTLAGTGIRWGEVTALKWSDVQLEIDRPTVRITRAWKKGATQRVLGITKTSRSRRTVSLPPEVVDVLLTLREGASPSPSDWIFKGPRSGQVHHQSFRRPWHAAVRRSGIEKRPRVHDLRHSHASWLIAARVPLPVIQRRLGHESIQTTIDVYGHLTDDADGLAAGAASLALAQAVPELLPSSN